MRETIQVGGCDILVERLGDGPPLVVLHNEDGPRQAAPFLEALSERFEVHIPYHAGWSETRRASHVRTTRDVALVAQEYLERFDQAVAVVGLSFGGWLGAEIASNAPYLVSRLMLVSPIGVKVGGREDRDFADLYILAAPERTALYYRPDRPPEMQTGHNTDIFLEKAIADDCIARFCWQPYMHDPGLAGRLRRISAPTLILSGERDQFILNSGYYARYADLIPDARHHLIAGAGHRLEEEDPRGTAGLIGAFASEASALYDTTF